MASATPATPSTKETTNYVRLCRVLVDVGTCALRDSFDAICTPPTLHTFLAANQPTLQSLRSRRIINATQWGKLFPAIPASVSSRDFDITLLMILLRNVCGLAPPLTGWDSLPAAADFSHEADIARIKYLRNTVYAHAEHASVDDATFDKHWKDIRDTLERDCFDLICTPLTLHTVLAANQPTLQSLRSKRIINPTQWGKLFPPIPASASSRDFDITLLMILLRNICGLAPPLTGWDALPGATDVSCEADIARVKYFRNTVYGHAEQAFVDDATFDTH